MIKHNFDQLKFDQVIIFPITFTVDFRKCIRKKCLNLTGKAKQIERRTWKLKFASFTESIITGKFGFLALLSIKVKINLFILVWIQREKSWIRHYRMTFLFCLLCVKQCDFNLNWITFRMSICFEKLCQIAIISKTG